MHYYQFNIADYQSHTRHLSPIEDICYRRMLDWVYLHEKPLPSEPKEVARILILNECLTDVEQVLNEFFTHVEQGWINVRAQSEIEAFNEKLEKASKAGKASAEARKNKVKQSLKSSKQAFNERSTGVQPNKKHKPLNNNQETILFSEVSKEILDQWLAVRKKKRGSPLSEIVYKSIVRESSKLGLSVEQAIIVCVERNWITFNADWCKGSISNSRNKSEIITDDEFNNWLNAGQQQEKIING